MRRAYRSDTAHTDDTEDLALGIPSGYETALPLAVPDIHLGAVELTQSRDGEVGTDGGCSVIDGHGSVGHLDVAGGTCVHVD